VPAKASSVLRSHEFYLTLIRRLIVFLKMRQLIAKYSGLELKCVALFVYDKLEVTESLLEIGGHW